MSEAKLLVLHGDARALHRLEDLAAFLGAGDVLAVNDAATIPASLSGDGLELRLLAHRDGREWEAVLLGAGDWRTPTEEREAPRRVAAGEVLRLAAGVTATVLAVAAASERLLTVRLSGGLEAIYAAGKHIQYAYRRDELRLWENQTLLAAKPVALEPPSAAMNLTWRLLLDLRRRGVEVVALTHATGVSSTGDERVDALLPLPERYEIPEATAAAVNAALRAGRRVIAVGTGTMRALESAALGGAEPVVAAGHGRSCLRITAQHRRRVVSGLLTGLHAAGSSHLDLLASLIAPAPLNDGYRAAAAAGFRWHELGDVSLITAR